jgi:hypothetical protein
MQKFKAIRTQSGKWVSRDVVTGKFRSGPGIIEMSSWEFKDAATIAERTIGEPCHLVEVIVIERGEIPHRSTLLQIARRIGGPDEICEEWRACGDWLRKLAEAAE